MLKNILDELRVKVAPTKLIDLFNRYTLTMKEDYRHVVLLIDDLEYVTTTMTGFYASMYQYAQIITTILVTVVITRLAIENIIVMITAILLLAVCIMFSIQAIFIRLFVRSLKHRN